MDVNLFPVNMIERVDVLKEGAGAIYGTDAIGGVVNFITRTEFDGLELSYDYGVTSESDGARDNCRHRLGHEQRPRQRGLRRELQQAGRDFGRRPRFLRNALYLYGGVVSGGSSRTPNGRISFGGATPESAALASSIRLRVMVTMIEGARGIHSTTIAASSPAAPMPTFTTTSRSTCS